MDSERLEKKIGDLEHAIDVLDEVVNDLINYDEFSSELEMLEDLISTFSSDVDELKEELDIALENEEYEWKMEREHEEKEYWNSRI